MIFADCVFHWAAKAVFCTMLALHLHLPLGAETAFNLRTANCILLQLLGYIFYQADLRLNLILLILTQPSLFKMSSIGTGYDLSAGQFSPDGRVFQVEYAQKAVENSGSVIAIRGSDGVVFGVEKIITSKLYEEGCNRRVYSIDDHIGAAVSGMLSDARAVVNRSRDEAANYRNTYQIPIPLKTLTERVGKYMHYFTVYSSLRPFGVR